MMIKPIEYHGICSTCQNAPNCTLQNDPMRPVWYCEEFEGIEPITLGSVNREVAPTPGPRGSPRDGVQGLRDLRGLCMNCENRETCTFPKPEGGVWHCDEYR